MDLYVGTSGFSYQEWKGKFYPDDLPAKGMLNFYSGRFRTVEINNTFHRMPKSSTLEAWAGEVPEGFKFALKAPQRITHLQRLRGVEESLSYFFEVAGAMGEKLGSVLFQLPPGLHKDVPLLRDFLALLPPRRRVAIQFQHRSWFDDESLQLLADNEVALCVVESEDGVEVPLVRTAEWGYLRLRRLDYGDEALKGWLKRLRAQRWGEVFVYFKHEEGAVGPLLAGRLLELAGKETGK